MTGPERSIHTDEVARLERFSSRFSRMGDHFVFSHLTPGTDPIEAFDAPMRIDGLTLLLCRSGSMHAQLNLCEYDIKGGDLLVISPDTLTRISDVDYATTDAYVIFVASRFLLDINIDIKTINVRNLVESHSPVHTLTDSEALTIVNYYELLVRNAEASEHNIFTHSIARSLLSALIYQLMQLNLSRLSKDNNNSDDNKGTNQYVHDFLTLLHLHYTSERSVAFYAEKLCISAKYLTVLVKEATGRSASAWINTFVILEAKNLLRYSGKNVQQVAYALNFASQSSFGKYFKHLTGMSPTQFQRS